VLGDDSTRPGDTAKRVEGGRGRSLPSRIARATEDEGEANEELGDKPTGDKQRWLPGMTVGLEMHLRPSAEAGSKSDMRRETRRPFALPSSSSA
jgi:hypothetical protein